MNIRRYLTPKAKAALWQHQDERCAYCARPLKLTDAQADHMHPLWCDGKNNENFQLLCRACHASKTKGEATARSKMKRLERIRLDGRKPKASKIESRGFSKRLRRRMNGTVGART